MDAIDNNPHLKPIFGNFYLPVTGHISFRVSYTAVLVIHLVFDLAALASLWPEPFAAWIKKEPAPEGG
jgi:hypothetical protein